MDEMGVSMCTNCEAGWDWMIHTAACIVSSIYEGWLLKQFYVEVREYLLVELSMCITITQMGVQGLRYMDLLNHLSYAVQVLQ
jgi:hypothetical protein